MNTAYIRGPLIVAVLAGLLFGCALFQKETDLSQAGDEVADHSYVQDEQEAEDSSSPGISGLEAARREEDYAWNLRPDPTATPSLSDSAAGLSPRFDSRPSESTLQLDVIETAGQSSLTDSRRSSAYAEDEIPISFDQIPQAGSGYNDYSVPPTPRPITGAALPPSRSNLQPPPANRSTVASGQSTAPPTGASVSPPSNVAQLVGSSRFSGGAATQPAPNSPATSLPPPAGGSDSRQSSRPGVVAPRPVQTGPGSGPSVNNTNQPQPRLQPALKQPLLPVPTQQPYVSPQALKERGQNAYQQNQFDVAIRSFERYLSAGYPDDDNTIRWYLAMAYQQKGRWAQAREEFNKLASSPRAEVRAEALYRTALIDIKAGQREEGIGKLNRVVSEYRQTKIAPKARLELQKLGY